MSDKYNQIKQTWKIKSILNEAANNWKQSYGCYPTIGEFINLINENDIVLLNISDILIENRLITSNDITWLSKKIINEQDAGDAYFNNASPKDIEELIKGAPGNADKIRDRYARAQAAKKDNAAGKKGERANAERTAAEAAQNASTAEKMKTAQQEAGKRNSAQQEASRQERIRQAQAAKAAEQQKAADWQEANKRERVRPEAQKTQVPPESVKPVGEKITTPSWNMPSAGTVVKAVVKSPYTLGKGLINSAPAIIGSQIGRDLAKEYFGPGLTTEIPGEVAGALVGGKAGTVSLGMMKNIMPWAPEGAALTRNRGYELRHNPTLARTLGWVGGLHLAEPFTKDMDTLPKMGVDMAAMYGGELAATKVVSPLVSKVATKVAPNAMKVAGQIGAKIGKFAPVVGAGLIVGGLYGAGQKALAGDPYGAGLDAASSVISPIPVVGLPIGVALDAASAYHDMSPEDREELKKKAAKSIPTPQNIGKAATSGLQKLVPSNMQVPEKSEDEKQRIRMLKPELQTIQEQFLNSFLKAVDKEVVKSGSTVLEKEKLKSNPLKDIFLWLDKKLPKQAEPTSRPVKEMEPNKFETPTTPTVYPITKSPLDPITLPTTPPTRVVPTIPLKPAPITLPTTTTAPPTNTDLAAKTITDLATKTAPKAKTGALAKVETKTETKTDKKIPAKTTTKTDEKILAKPDEKTKSKFQWADGSVLPDAPSSDSYAPTERYGASVARANPFYDQQNNLKYNDYILNVNESRSGTLNTKTAVQNRAKKQQYKVVVVQDGKKLEIFAKSIQGIRRAVFGKKNFRVYDGKGSDITNYFKRLMAGKKST